MALPNIQIQLRSTPKPGRTERPPLYASPQRTPLFPISAGQGPRYKLDEFSGSAKQMAEMAKATTNLIGTVGEVQYKKRLAEDKMTATEILNDISVEVNDSLNSIRTAGYNTEQFTMEANRTVDYFWKQAREYTADLVPAARAAFLARAKAEQTKSFIAIQKESNERFTSGLRGRFEQELPLLIDKAVKSDSAEELSSKLKSVIDHISSQRGVTMDDEDVEKRLQIAMKDVYVGRFKLDARKDPEAALNMLASKELKFPGIGRTIHLSPKDVESLTVFSSALFTRKIKLQERADKKAQQDKLRSEKDTANSFYTLIGSGEDVRVNAIAAADALGDQLRPVLQYNKTMVDARASGHKSNSLAAVRTAHSVQTGINQFEGTPGFGSPFTHADIRALVKNESLSFMDGITHMSTLASTQQRMRGEKNTTRNTLVAAGKKFISNVMQELRIPGLPSKMTADQSLLLANAQLEFASRIARDAKNKADVAEVAQEIAYKYARVGAHNLLSNWKSIRATIPYKNETEIFEAYRKNKISLDERNRMTNLLGHLDAIKAASYQLKTVTPTTKKKPPEKGFGTTVWDLIFGAHKPKRANP